MCSEQEENSPQKQMTIKYNVFISWMDRKSEILEFKLI